MRKLYRKIRFAGITFLLFLLLALPVTAAEANITAQMTMKEIRANESLRASGYCLYPRGDDASPLAEARWENKTLEEYVNHPAARDTARGLNLIVQNYNAGVAVTRQLYSAEEIEQVPSRAKAQLYYYPADGGEVTKYALILPGNMFERIGMMTEGSSTAWKLHELGYTAFELRYRISSDAADDAPLEDVRRAVRYITQNAEELRVSPEDYAIVGYSSGGQLAGLFAGQEELGGLPRPGALLLGYPVNNFTVARVLYRQMMDAGEAGRHYYDVRISDVVTAKFPPTYHWYGKNDRMLWVLSPFVGAELEQTLKEAGVPHRYVVYQNAPHGVATGVGTDAENWLEDAVAFWEEQVCLSGE